MMNSSITELGFISASSFCLSFCIHVHQTGAWGSHGAGVPIVPLTGSVSRVCSLLLPVSLLTKFEFCSFVPYLLLSDLQWLRTCRYKYALVTGPPESSTAVWEDGENRSLPPVGLFGDSFLSLLQSPRVPSPPGASKPSTSIPAFAALSQEILKTQIPSLHSSVMILIQDEPLRSIPGYEFPFVGLSNSSGTMCYASTTLQVSFSYMCSSINIERLSRFFSMLDAFQEFSSLDPTILHCHR